MKAVISSLAVLLLAMSPTVSNPQAEWSSGPADHERLLSERDALVESIATLEELLLTPGIYLVPRGDGQPYITVAEFEYRLAEIAAEARSDPMIPAEDGLRSLTIETDRARRAYLLDSELPSLREQLAELERRILVSAPAPAGRSASTPEFQPLSTAEADRLIGGDWLLELGGREHRVHIRRQDDMVSFAGTLSVHYLACYRQGDTLFVVKPDAKEPGVFVGLEHGFDDPHRCNPRRVKLRLEVQGDQLRYDNGEQQMLLQRR